MTAEGCADGDTVISPPESGVISVRNPGKSFTLWD